MKIRPHNLDIQAWSTYTTRFKLVSPGFDIRVLKTDEYVMVRELRELWNARGGAPGAKGEVVRRDKEGGVVNEDGVNVSKKMKKISEMEVNTFSDLVCEVPLPFAYLSIFAITKIDILRWSKHTPDNHIPYTSQTTLKTRPYSPTNGPTATTTGKVPLGNTPYNSNVGTT
jgi:hypothetical protein